VTIHTGRPSDTTGRARRARTVLVTGAAGFVGSHLCERLLDRGDRVVGLDAFIDYYPRHIKEGNLYDLRTRPGFRFEEADLRTANLYPLLEDVDVVVHAAAMPGLPKSWVDFELYGSCNLLATQRLAEAARVVGLDKLVYVSTSSVYGADAVGDENLVKKPISPYGVTKLAAEHLLEAYHAAFDLPVVTLRYFSVYGPRQRPDMAYNIFIERLLDGQPLTIFGDGHQTRSNTYVDDCVRGTMAAIDHGPVGEVFNIGGGEVVSVLDTVRRIEELVGVRADITHVAAREGDQRCTAADTSRAQRLLGYRPQVAPAEGVELQVAYQQALRDRRTAAALLAG
jgi:nucleoside-diphosphate-sugar epimerase